MKGPFGVTGVVHGSVRSMVSWLWGRTFSARKTRCILDTEAIGQSSTVLNGTSRPDKFIRIRLHDARKLIERFNDLKRLLAMAGDLRPDIKEVAMQDIETIKRVLLDAEQRGG